MKVRASHSGHLLTGLFWVEACWAGWPPRQLPCRGSSRAVVLASGAGSPRHHLMGGGRGGPRPQGLELVPYPPHPVHRSPAVELDSLPQVPLCASRSAPAAAARPCTSLVSLLLPPPPPLPSPPPVGAARAASKALALRACGVAPGVRRRSARGRLGEAPGRLPLGRARSGGHPRPRRGRRLPRRSVPAALIVVCDCVCLLSKKSM